MTVTATRSWSPQQDDALRDVRAWLKDKRGPQVFSLFGYAGTGKTTLAIEIAGMVDTCLFASFTGKAALVMRRKGCDDASTIHKLIYRVVEGEDVTTFELNHASALRDADLLIVDECSMVDEEIGRDLLSFKTKILVLGDPAQLPPVTGAGFFTEIPEPHVMLTEVHRQAAGNPIVRLATEVRNGDRPTLGNYRGVDGSVALSVVRRGDVRNESLLAADQVICGTNAFRRTLNQRMRRLLREAGKLPKSLVDDHMPVDGDRIICLRNDHDLGIYNGGMFRIKSFHDRDEGERRKGDPGVSYLGLGNDDEPEMRDVRVCVPHEFWNGREAEIEKQRRRSFHEFDYGYAITCHKSQGSQWGKVLAFDDSSVFARSGADQARRWLYTAITRAADKLIVAL